MIWSLSREIAHTLRPNVKDRRDDMDILAYVHVKKLLTNAEKPIAQVVFGTVRHLFVRVSQFMAEWGVMRSRTELDTVITGINQIGVTIKQLNSPFRKHTFVGILKSCRRQSNEESYRSTVGDGNRWQYRI